MRPLAIWTSWGRTSTFLSSTSNSEARISSGQYMVSRTSTSSLNRRVHRCSFSRKATFATATLPSSAIDRRSSVYALTPCSSGTT